ncbi:hypothetical protein [Protaetiibacter larvae]|uniref:hypothetical protein n=1 Tax=Protaetiibacter larvae TaxID=2592654 RepID=UPI00143CEC8F
MLGQGVEVGDEVAIYQSVTLGAGRGGEYPRIERGVTLFANSVVAGGVCIGEGTVVGACVYLARDTSPNSTVRQAAPVVTETHHNGERETRRKN